MSPMLLPTRFRFEQAQVAAALTVASVWPNSLSKLPPLPPVDQPYDLLQAAGLLDGGSQRLSQEAEAAIRAAAEPAYLVSVVANRAGDPVWGETVLARGAGEGPFVAQASVDGSYDLALIPSATAVTVLIDELLGLTELPARPGGQPVALGLPGYAALLAAADFVQEARLRTRLSRMPQPEPLLTAPDLERLLGEGLARPDTRWAVAAGRMICPCDLRLASGRMGEGLAGLQEAGLVEPAAAGYRFTRVGYVAANALGQLVRAGGLRLTIERGLNRVGVAQVGVFRSVMGIWLAAWATFTPQDASLLLVESSVEGALSLIRRMVEPADLPRLPAAAPPVAQPPAMAAPPPAPAAPTPGWPPAAVPQPPSPVAPGPPTPAWPPPAAQPSPSTPTPAPAAPVPFTPPAAPPPAPPEPSGTACPSCRALNQSGAAFCVSCGSVLRRAPEPSPVAPPPPPPAPAFCTHCGARGEPGTRFCTTCGNRIGG